MEGRLFMERPLLLQNVFISSNTKMEVICYAQ